MLPQENLAANFCGLLDSKGYKDLPIEWRILGQEQDGSLLASWISIAQTKSGDDKITDRSHIGVYSPVEKSFDVLYSFQRRENVIQASLNTSRTLLSYVLKNTILNESGEDKHTYIPYLVEIKGEKNAAEEPYRLLPDAKSKQVMTQFLWRQKGAFEKTYQDKVLVFIHEENIHLFKATLIKQKNNQNPDDLTSSKIDFKDADSWALNRTNVTSEVIVKHFIWAQWDPAVQALYYIHLKPAMRSSLEKDDGRDKDFMTTLSAHQFHEALPRETVVSYHQSLIVFSMPSVHNSIFSASNTNTTDEFTWNLFPQIKQFQLYNFRLTVNLSYSF